MKTPLQLHELPIGSRAIIAGYGMINEFTERLQELGLIPGTLIKIVRRAPFKGPVEDFLRHQPRGCSRARERFDLCGMPQLMKPVLKDFLKHSFKNFYKTDF